MIAFIRIQDFTMIIDQIHLTDLTDLSFEVFLTYTYLSGLKTKNNYTGDLK